MKKIQEIKYVLMQTKQQGIITIDCPSQHNHLLVTEISCRGRPHYVANHLESLMLLKAPARNNHWNYDARNEMNLLYGKDLSVPYQNLLDNPYTISSGGSNLLYWTYGMNFRHSNWNHLSLTVSGVYF